jgi:transposase
MAKPLLPDELWALIQPLIPPHPPQPKGGRPFLDDRKVLTGIIFILKTGLPWEDLPQDMGCGSGMTCWNRLRDWQAAGVWGQIHQIFLAHLRHADKIDFGRFIADTAHVRAVGGGEETGPSPVDRSRTGSKHARGPHRRPRRALGHRHHPGEHSGCQPSGAVGGRGPPRRRQAGPPPETSGPCHGRPGL